MISCLIPSRGRCEQLTRCVDSIYTLAKNPSDVEVLVAIDEDDCETCALQLPGVQWVVSEQLNNIQAYFNKMVSLARGNVFLVLNDDCLVASRGWDEECYIQQGRYGRTSPYSASGGYSEFPVLTRAGFNALGWLMPEQYPGWGGDHFVYRCYAGLVEDLQVWVKHERDEQGASFQRMARISGYYDAATADVSEWTARLYAATAS